MNDFSDIHITFGDARPPVATRLGNPWACALEGPGGIWTSAGQDHQPTAVSEARWTVYAVGNVFAYRGSEDSPLERFAADLAAGRASPVELDAHAALVAWDEGERQAHVWTDRMGTMHLYVGGRPGRPRLGTSFAAVAEESSGAVDWIGVTGFCGFGFYPADRTPYDDVRIVRPATHSTFDEAGAMVSQERYWAWHHEPQVRRSDVELADQFHEVWLSTLRRQVAGRPVVVPISGGLDSRTVLAGLGRSGRPKGDDAVRAFTYGYEPSSVETRIGRKVAAAREMAIDEQVVRRYLFDRLPDIVGAVEGFQALSLSRQVGSSRKLASIGTRIVGGHWGDVWFDTAGATDVASSSPGDLVDVAFAKMAKRGREWLLDNLCRPHLGGRDPEDLLKEVLRAELERLPDLGDPDLQLKALKTEQWSFRWTLASTRAYHLARPTLLPFYANEVVDLFLGIPSDRLVGRRLQIAYLRRHHPDLARVPWQATGMSLFERPWERPLALARRAAAKGARTVRRRQVIERNWEVQYLTGDGPERLRRLALSGRSGPLATVGAGDLESLLGRFAADPDAGSGHVVDVLATLAAVVAAPPDGS